MTKEKFDDGGPAFPTDNQAQVALNTFHYEGMSLWDFFAAQTLSGIIGSFKKYEKIDGSGPAICRSDLVAVAASYADAMIAERRKRMG